MCEDCGVEFEGRPVKKEAVSDVSVMDLGSTPRQIRRLESVATIASRLRLEKATGQLHADQLTTSQSAELRFVDETKRRNHGTYSFQHATGASIGDVYEEEKGARGRGGCGHDKRRKIDRAHGSWEVRLSVEGPHLLCIIPGWRMGPLRFACGRWSIISVKTWQRSLVSAFSTASGPWVLYRIASLGQRYDAPIPRAVLPS
jgi:hypothetical protein